MASPRKRNRSGLVWTTVSQMGLCCHCLAQGPKAIREISPSGSGSQSFCGDSAKAIVITGTQIAAITAALRLRIGRKHSVLVVFILHSPFPIFLHPSFRGNLAGRHNAPPRIMPLLQIKAGICHGCLAVSWDENGADPPLLSCSCRQVRPSL